VTGGACARTQPVLAEGVRCTHERRRAVNAQRHEWFLQQVFGHRQAVMRYLRRFRFGQDDSEDLVQEALLRMYSLPDAGSVQSPRAMLFSIVHNLAVERLRRVGTQATDTVAEIETLGVFSSEAGPEQQADASQRFGRFNAIVSELPPVCRRAFVLRKIYGLSPEEIAQVLGSTVSTIEKHVAKGMVRCRDRMMEFGMLDAQAGDVRGRKTP